MGVSCLILARGHFVAQLLRQGEESSVVGAMTSFFEKARKLRGHISSGGGRIGTHGKHPGVCHDSCGHHHQINFDKYHPDLFGKEWECEVSI